jgi:hypothetical protein
MVQRTIGNQAMLQLLSQQTSSQTGKEVGSDHGQGALPENMTAREAPRGVSWDFSKIPLFPPDRANRSLTQKQAAPQTTSVASGVLQRKCACGNHAMGGECEECKKQEGSLQSKQASENSRSEVTPTVQEALRSPGQPLDAATRAFMEPWFGHDFSQVRVHTDAKAAGGTKQEPKFNPSAGRPVVMGSGEIYESSGTCTVGKSESNCVPVGVDKMEYKTTVIKNDCVTEPCTEEHENVHVRELDGCCKAYSRALADSRALNRPSADRAGIHDTYRDWIESARPVTECHAYMNDVACAQRLAQQRGCVPETREEGAPNRLAAVEAGTGGGARADIDGFAQNPSALSDLKADLDLLRPKRPQGMKGLAADCMDITWYQQTFGDRAAEKCSDAGGRSLPPCPFK